MLNNEQPTFPPLEFPDAERILLTVTQYVEERINKVGAIARPIFRVADDNRIDIILDGGVSLNGLLPEVYDIHNNSRSGEYMLGGGVSWDLEGRLININVEFDVNWVTEHGDVALCGVAHEIGHALSIERVNEIEEYYKKTLPEYKYPFESSEDIEHFLEYTVAGVSMFLECEVQAYNYGKIIADSFGINPDTYESNIHPRLMSHLTHVVLGAKQRLQKYIGEFEATTNVPFKSNKVFKLYDTTSQDMVELSYDDLKKHLDLYTQEVADEAGQEALLRVS